MKQAQISDDAVLDSKCRRFFLKTERLPGPDVICGLSNDAVKRVDIVTRRDDGLIMYIAIRRMA